MDFERTLEEWRALGARKLDEAAFERFETLEAELLCHRPGDPDQAHAIIGVMLSNAGERSDAGDRQAPLNIRAFLLGGAL